MSNSEEFARMAKEVMYYHNLKQTQLAERLGCNQSYISDVMRGKKSASENIMEKLRAMLGEEPEPAGEDSPQSRMLAFVRYKGMSQQQFELSIGMGNGWLNKVGDNIRETTLRKIRETYPELNIAWLKSGVGEMLNHLDTKQINDLVALACYTLRESVGELAQRMEMSGDHLAGIMQGDRPIPPGFEERLNALVTGAGISLPDDRRGSTAKLVPLVPMKAQGGNLNEFRLSVRLSDCNFVFSPFDSADMAIPIIGDSMAPEYPNGAVIYIKRINEAAFIEWGRVFVLDTCNGVVIKKLTVSDNEGCVRCVSINPDPVFAPFDIAKSDIEGFYRVLGCISLK